MPDILTKALSKSYSKPKSEPSWFDQNKPDVASGQTDWFAENAPEQEESTAQKIWRLANTPLVKPSGQMGQAIEQLNQEHPWATAIPRNIYDTFSSMTSPLSLGLMGLSGGSSLATRFGSPLAAKIMNIPGRAASAGMILHGGSKVIDPNATGPERFGGAFEALLGFPGLAPHSVPEGKFKKPAPKATEAPKTPESPIETPPSQPVVKQPIPAQPAAKPTPPSTDEINSAFGFKQPQTPEHVGPLALNERWFNPEEYKNIQDYAIQSGGNLTARPMHPGDPNIMRGEFMMNALDQPQLGMNPLTKIGQSSTFKMPIKTSIDYANDALKANKPANLTSEPKPDIGTLKTKAFIDADNAAQEYFRGNRPIKGKLDLIDKIQKYNQYDPENSNPTIRHYMDLIREEGRTPPANPIEPSLDKVGKAGVDFAKQSAGKIIGRALYKEGGPKAATKELLQNAYDATKGMGAAGKVKVVFGQGVNEPNTFVRVEDNGPGLTLEELKNAFVKIGESGKTGDLDSAGKFGFGKASYLLGGDKATVETVVVENGKRVKYTFEGTPDEFLSDNPPDIERTKVKSDEPTGTKVTTYFPKGTNYYNAGEFVNRFNKYSTAKQELNHIMDLGPWINKERLEHVEKLDPRTESTPIASLQNEFAKINLSIPKDAERKTAYGMNLNLFNNGLYQASQRYATGKVPNLPSDVNVDIKALVHEKHTQYPWTANREEIREQTLKDVQKYIDENIVKPSVNQRTSELTEAYQSMKPVNLPTKAGSRQFYVYDTGKLFTPQEIDSITKNEHVQELATHISDNVHDFLLKSENKHIAKRLERVGLIFDDRLNGVKIPNPEAPGNNAILINPLQIMKDYPNPDNASVRMAHTTLHEIAHLEAGDHDENFTIELGRLYGVIGRKGIRNYEDAIFNSISDPSTGQYRPEFQELLQKYTESRGRAKTNTDPLIGTGVGDESKKPSGEGEVLSSAKPNPRRAAPERAAIDNLRAALQEGSQARDVQSQINRYEHGVRGAKYASVKGEKAEGQAGFYRKKAMLQGKFPETAMGPLQLSQEDVDSLFTSINNSVTLTDYQQLNAGEGLERLLSGRPPTGYQLKMMNNIFGDDFSNIVEMHGGFGQGLITSKATRRQLLYEAVNLPKSFMASIDFSAALRQGLPFIRKKEYWRAFKEMFSYFGDQKAYQALRDSIEARPLNLLGEMTGLAARDPAKIFNREEAFISHWAESGEFLGNKVLQKAYQKTAGAAVAASDRAYTGFLHKLRSDVFDDLVYKADKAGSIHLDRILNELNTADGFSAQSVKELALVRSISKMVNTSTGRGTLGRFEKNAVELNSLLFSPRMIASRLQMMNPMYYINETNPMLRQEKIRALMSVAGFGLVLTGLGASMGAKVSSDPTNADFMKIRIGNTRFDPWTGFQQYVVAAARLLKGHTTSSTSGKVRQYNQGYNAPTRLEEVERFGRSKLSPIASFAADILAGTDWQGQPLNMKDEIASRFTPLIIQDLQDVAKNDPDVLPLATVAATFGMGVQSYNPPNKIHPAYQRKLTVR